MTKDNDPKAVNEELLKNNPDQTIPPTPIKLHQKPIPDPDLEDSKKKSQ